MNPDWTNIFLEYEGKQSATPLLLRRIRLRGFVAKAPSPLCSAGAVQKYP